MNMLGLASARLGVASRVTSTFGFHCKRTPYRGLKAGARLLTSGAENDAGTGKSAGPTGKGNDAGMLGFARRLRRPSCICLNAL